VHEHPTSLRVVLVLLTNTREGARTAHPRVPLTFSPRKKGNGNDGHETTVTRRRCTFL